MRSEPNKMKSQVHLSAVQKLASRLLCGSVAAMVVFGGSLHAINFVWDPDGSGGNCNAGGNGTWNTTSLFWNTNDCNGTYFVWSDSTNNTATFPGSALYTNTLSANVILNKLTNACGVATTTSSTLRMTGFQITFGGPTPIIDTTNKLTMDTPLKGAVTLTKTGAGQLQLNNNGQTISKYIIKGGLITSANTNKWGTGVGSAQDAVTLDGGGMGFDTGSQTYNNFGITLASGGGAIGLFNGTLTVTLNTKITGTGGLNFGGGAASTDGYNATGTYILGNTANDFSGTLRISKGTLKLGASGVVPDAAAVQVDSATTLDFNGFNEAIRSLQGNSATAGGTVNIGTNTITLNRTSGTTSFPGIISGSGNLIKTNAGVQHLIGINTYSGKTVIGGGTLGINGDASLGTAPGSVVPDHLTFIGGTLLSSNAFTLDSNRGITLQGAGTWNVNETNVEASYAGVITGVGTFTKAGPGILTLSGQNTYTNGTLVSGGTLKFGLPTTIQDTTTIAVNGAATVLDINNADITLDGLSGTGSILSSGGLPGSITVTNGRVAAGTSLTGNAVGLLTMQSGLNFLNSTNRWELANLKDDTDGTGGVDFDQILMNPSSTLGVTGACVLSINFTSAGNAPDFATPFWTNSHKWTVIKMNGGSNPNSEGFVSVVTNAYYYAGSFSTAVEPDGSISLSYSPAGPTAPIILTQPASKNGVFGSTTNLSVSATGTAPLSYQWYFGANPVSGGTAATLTITNVQSSNGGNYYVVVTNDSGSAVSSNALLTVVYPPTIDTQPANQTVTVGSPATFNVAASGTAPFSFQWKKNGTNIVGATTNTFSIPVVSTNDAGNYSVVITNIAGTVTSSNALLTVSTSAFQPVATLSLSGTTVTLSWTSEAGTTYRPQYKNSLTDAIWTDIPPDITASGPISSIVTSSSGTTNRFYRIVVP